MQRAMRQDLHGVSDRFRRSVASALERGVLADRSLPHMLAQLWDASARRHFSRALPRPPAVRIIGVGSATLGGAGKTPLCISLARALARAGHRVGVVSHGYRSSATTSRVVGPFDATAAVGDDAVVCAGALAEEANVVCVSGRHRHASISLAAALGAEIVVVDGLLQACPRIDWSVLALDAGVGFGAGAPPPVGDLRAFPASLLEASDTAAVISDAALGEPGLVAPALDVSLPAAPVYGRLLGALDATGGTRGLSELRQLRLALVLGIARPERVVRSLERRGIVLSAVIELADHARPSARTLEILVRDRLERAGASAVDAFLTTARCAGNLPAFIAGRPLWSLLHELDAGPLLALAPPRIIQRIETPRRPYYAARP